VAVYFGSMKWNHRALLPWLCRIGILVLTGSASATLVAGQKVSRADTLYCAQTRIVFSQRCEGVPDSILLLHVHEDETTAVQAANRLLDATRQGCFVTWKSQQQRYISFQQAGKQYRFDPNRIFSDTGIKLTLKWNENSSYPAFEAVKRIADSFLIRYIAGRKLLIALHNNTDKGSLSAASYRKGAAYENDAKQVYLNPAQDMDDFFYTTDVSFFNYFKHQGYNTVLQDDNSVTDDGSLSVYCGQQHIPYINIEAQHGHLQQQIKMLQTVLAGIRAGR
jgi:hypothetical protein